MSLTISRYKGGRNWAVREADTGSLVVVTLYRKGAVEVVRRLTGAIPELPRRKRQDTFVYEAKDSLEVTL
ncbi:hypothetical protein [Armatimonas sp.]|uniref:hypothetical protein n=1 Tax=Armatimonas sp. TaxID=1872638 RepID=UPI00286C914F|nr:hypothetical protein [Armatimonas sp.]